eukprot:INCI9384.2.p1 GENE.INCI9384.2~~INCI9384.2.p1  ORF type:complete len:595 (-),score=101.48 INCI9384.2:264-2048(-)
MADVKRLKLEGLASALSGRQSPSPSPSAAASVSPVPAAATIPGAVPGDPKLPRKLLQSIKDGDCVVFVGAGFSAPARLPSWTKLLEILVDALCGTEASNTKRVALRMLLGYDANGKWVGGGTSETFDQCAQCIEDELGETRVHELIEEALKLPDTLAPEMEARRDLLTSIPFRAILTTNYDDILPGIAAETPEAKRIMRGILREAPRPFERFLKTSSVGIDNAGSSSMQTPGRQKAPYQLGRKDPRNWGPILRLHGAVGNAGGAAGGPILSRKGYRRLLRGNEAYQNFLSAVMAAKTILYIGFSFTDYYINELRRSVVDMLGEFRTEDAPVAYAIVNDMDEAKRAFYRRHEGVEVLSFDTTGGDWTGFERILSGIRDKTNPARLYAESLRGKRILYVTRLFDASPTAADDAAGNVAEVHKVGSQAQALKKRKSSEISSSIVGSDNEGECKGIQRSQSWWFRESAWNDGRRLAEFLAAASEHLPKDERVNVEVLNDSCKTIVSSAMERLRKASAANEAFDLVISDHGSEQFGLVAGPLLAAMHSGGEKVPLLVHGGPVPGRKEAIIRLGAIDYTYRWEALFGGIQKLLAPGEGTI